MCIVLLYNYLSIIMLEFQKLLLGRKMSKKMLLLSSIIAGSVLFTGCATILDGKTQTINLQSKKDLIVNIDGREFTSPSIIELDRSDKDKVLKIKECNKQILLKKEVNPTFFVNILSGGAFGSTTDYSSNAMWQYDQDNLNVDCN